MVSEVRNTIRRHGVLIAFTVFALWIVGTRWVLRHEPMERDLATYAVIGREMLTGRVLYSDLWDHKPPGIHLVYAAATLPAGPGAPAVLLVNVVFSIMVMGGLICAGGRIAGTPGAIVAGSLWTLVGSDLGLQANQPNVELPINACIAWALAASLAGRSRSKRKTGWVMGALTSCGLLLKPVVAAPLGLLAAVEAVDVWRQSGINEFFCFVIRWLVAISLGLAVVVGWCVYRAGFGPVWDALVRYNLAYGKGQLLTNLLNMMDLRAHLPASSIFTIGFLVVVGVAGFAQMNTPERRRVAAVLAGSAIAVAAPGRFYPHYFQLLLPPLVVAAAIGLACFLRQPGVRRLFAIVVLTTLGLIQFSSLQLSSDEWSRLKYGEVFLDEIRLARILEEYVNPGEYFWQLGPQPGLYLLTNTVPASGVIYDYPLLPTSPLRDRLAARIVADLEVHLPRVLVVQDRRGDRGVFSWIRQHYRVVDTTTSVEGYRLWALNE